ncbi:MAG: helix-turn-helix transcriptional regulator [Deltaproteobacteria bacterium]|nr:helix-turn-helix transcriptional regulator [Deltaproteobacteria bacterium]
MKGAKIQTIELGGERAVIVPLEVWEELMERFEQIEDIALLDSLEDDPDEELVKHDQVCRELGLCPLRCLRHQAEMTQTELARRTRLSQSFIARVESNDKRLSATSRRKIARALKLPESKLIY